MLIRSESELLVRQLEGAYRVKHPPLQDLHRQACAVLDGFTSWQVEHVPRRPNAEAVWLANKGIDMHLAVAA